MEAPTILKIHEWDEALNQVARHLFILASENSSLMINEKRDEREIQLFLQNLNVSYAVRTRFYCSCSLFRNNIKSLC
jgi:hypothetical protein